MFKVGHKYKTVCEYDVFIHDIKLSNEDNSIQYTFPIKGSYYTKTKSGRLKSHYNIWSIDGKHDVCRDSKLDLVKG